MEITPRERRALWLLLAIVIVALLSLVWASASRRGCPGDPCLWSWYSATCAAQCPYDTPVGPIRDPVGIPAREVAPTMAPTIEAATPPR